MGVVQTVQTVADLAEVLGKESSAEIILEGPNALRQQLILNERVFGPGTCQPRIEIIFRLADDPESNLLSYRSGSWALASELAANDVAGSLERIGGAARGVLSTEPVTFVARNGEHRGMQVTYDRPVLVLIGPAAPHGR